MFNNLRLWANIMIGMGFAIAFVVIGLIVTGLNNLEGVILRSEEAQLRERAESVITQVQSETRLAQALSALVAHIPLVQEKFEQGDRAWLAQQLEPAYQVIARDFGAKQFQFHTPPAFSFLRLHKPEKFGDDLSSFRHMVVNTNEKKSASQGLESGVAGLGARGIVPVFHGEKHLGSVEFGMSFGPAFFTAFKQKHGADAALYLFKEGKFITFASTMPEALLQPQELKQAYAGKRVYTRRAFNATPYAIYGTMVKDYSGTPLGVVEIAMNRSAHVAAFAKARNQAWIIGGLALLVGLLLALLTARALGRRIRALVQGVNLLAEGNLTVSLPSDGQNEIAELGRATEEMRSYLHDLVSKVEHNASAVNHASREIATSVERQAATSSGMSASVAEITSTMEELSASSSQIAEYSEKVVVIANQTWESSKEGSLAMQSIVTKMEDIKSDNEKSLAEIVDLGSKSKEISKVMEIINNIADQTKLIAFNAALEASSAGESGQRFGVVAAEIRRLADSVTESTSEIERKTREIQDSISRLVITSEKGALGITEGMRESFQTATRLNELVDAASRSTKSAKQISLSTQQQKTASSQVVVALREIVTASSNTADAVEHIAQIANQMTDVSSELKAQVGRFILHEDQHSH
ncbi:methyl-accepting chemotaxis sensory transducer [Magnetococcus marinus MC-1]|uniref:Methyl-accepting chemotaxis sensory transducer n=1 Tax=Magnetococcus marinus (strain ATCC BAA-1437 / JCM 17883 / MC-1) TaxID=156889 RepID=A0L7P5_MAGMM|nr:methyl-accepting chemotaxis protein [Magnetococcus marinus]ABK43988.1 methyl-accepting chemotaxis sensory transducer [Magnetococcus marinus MC-1]